MQTAGSSPWEEAAFLAETRAWIESQVDVTGEIEQTHVRPPSDFKDRFAQGAGDGDD